MWADHTLTRSHPGPSVPLLHFYEDANLRHGSIVNYEYQSIIVMSITSIWTHRALYNSLVSWGSGDAGLSLWGQ
jgi:hypothetical protein